MNLLLPFAEMPSERDAGKLLQLLLDIALRYINVPIVQANTTIIHTLEEIGHFVNADRVYIFDYEFSDNTCSNTYEWCAEHITPEISALQKVPIMAIPQWVDAHRAGQEMYIADVPGLADNDPIKAILFPQGIKSILTLPMANDGELLGFVGFDSVKTFHNYTSEERTLLAVFAQMLVNIKIRIRAIRQLSVAKEKAEQAARVKSDFVANISHELRTPLNAIIGFSELLTYSSPSPTQSSYLQKIHQSSALLLNLINDVLDFSKLEAGKLQLHPEPVALLELIRQIHDLFNKAAQDKGLKLSFQLNPRIPQLLYFDPLRLTQILTNLISNAIKFTAQGRVSVNINYVEQRAGAHVLNFEVSDTGIGIESSKLSILCDAFTQADTSITRRYGGTGLGLAISSNLLGQMQSQLDVVSTPGKGSVFSFEILIPAANKVEFTAAITPKLPENMVFSGQRVLVAEDNSTNRLVILKMLERLGLEVMLAEDGAEALFKAAIQPVALVLMDLQMPVMDGFEATRQLKIRYPNLPVIALSAAVLDTDKAKAKAAGVDGHLTKPVSLAELSTTLYCWLSKQTK